MRLDSYDTYPSGMREYLSTYGWHFSKKMCEWAVSRMYKDGEDNKPEQAIPNYTRERVDLLLKRFNLKLENNKGYDDVYVANMCKFDFLGSSIDNEMKLAQFIKDYIDDADAYEGMPFTRFYADCIGSGTPIIWEDML